MDPNDPSAGYLQPLVTKAMPLSFKVSSKAAKFRYLREFSDFFSEVEKMDTIKRENCLEDSKLAKQANVVNYSLSNPVICSCVCWPSATHKMEVFCFSLSSS